MVDQTVVSPDGLKYTFTLRDGLRWHDGKPVLSEDCVESLKRWGKRDRLAQLLMAHTGKIAAVDSRTFTLQLAEPFGLVLDALENGGTCLHDARELVAMPPEDQIKNNRSARSGCKRRVEAGRTSRILTKQRLHPAQRRAERINRRQAGVPR
jgi:ABC-type transport system substrate-binding protein